MGRILLMQNIERNMRSMWNVRLGYSEFKEELKKRVEEKVGEGVKVNFSTSVKNNQTEKEVLIFREEGINMMPMIHLNDLYQEYWCNGNMEKLVNFVIEIFATRGNIDTGALVEKWDDIKEKICLKLIHYKWNEEFLKKVPYRRMLDLAIVLQIQFGVTEYGSMSTVVTEEVMKLWKVMPEEIWKTAIENIQKKEYIIMDLEEYICELKGQKTFPKETGKVSMQYVMTNAEQHDGAVGILQEKLLKSFAEQINQNFYIVPGSINEWIFMPESCGVEKSALDEMVRQINAEQINAEEWLSDHVYYYDRKTGTIKM